MSGRCSKARLLAVLLLALVSGGCASWRPPVDTSDAPLRARAVTQSVRGARLSAAVLDARDSVRMLGADVTADGVQPVWIEVENETSQYLVLLRPGTDPDYFSPLEVAWSVHTTFGGETNDRIDEHFDRMAFPNPIPPGATRSGLLYTNPQPMAKLLNVDLLGNRTLIPITLLVPVPGGSSGDDIERLHGYAQTELTDYEDLDQLRQALVQLPCCANDADGQGGPAPINVVFIGTFEDVSAALVRRGYRRADEPTGAQPQLFGRPAGIVARKTAQAGAPAIWLRVWRAPMKYRGMSVFAIQAGRPAGGRFAHAQAGPVRLHPAVDEMRNFLIGDLMYSGGLAQVGFFTGAGASSSAGRYFTDGLRVALFFATRPRSISAVEVLPWIEPRAPQPAAPVTQATQRKQP